MTKRRQRRERYERERRTFDIDFWMGVTFLIGTFVFILFQALKG